MEVLLFVFRHSIVSALAYFDPKKVYLLKKELTIKKRIDLSLTLVQMYRKSNFVLFFAHENMKNA